MQSRDLETYKQQFHAFHDILPFSLLSFVVGVQRSHFHHAFARTGSQRKAFQGKGGAVHHRLTRRIAGLHLQDHTRRTMHQRVNEVGVIRVLHFQSSRRFSSLPQASLLIRIVRTTTSNPHSVHSIGNFGHIPTIHTSSRTYTIVASNHSPNLARVPNRVLIRAVHNATVASRNIRRAPFQHARSLLLFNNRALILVVQVGRPSPHDGVEFIPRRHTPTQLTITPHAANLLVMHFSQFQRVVISRVARIQLISTRTRHVHNGRRERAINCRVALYPFPHFNQRATVVNSYSRTGSHHVLAFHHARLTRNSVW